jgi:hypothetical protein
VAAFLAHEAGRSIKPSTIGRRVAAIRYAHKLAGLPLPTDDERVRATVRGIRRSLGAAPAPYHIIEKAALCITAFLSRRLPQRVTFDV